MLQKPDPNGVTTIGAYEAKTRFSELIAPDIVDEALARLRHLPLKQDRDETINLIPSIVALARHHNLRVADAAYLELALRLGVPLAARDASLARAARQAGVPLFTA